MLNPEKRPTLKYLDDGSHVPTTKGLFHTQDTKDRIKRIRTGEPRPAEMIARSSIIWNVVRPFILRGGANIEIADVTGLSYEKVYVASGKNSTRPDCNKIDAKSTGLIQERRKRAFVYTKKRKKTKGVIPESEKKSIKFANILRRGRLFGDDLTNWNILKGIYKRYGRKLPEDFSDMLRLEVFLSAILSQREGDQSELVRYRNLGSKIDEEWFDRSLSTEENFLSLVIRNKIDGFSEDHVGLFRSDDHGKWRFPMGGNDSSFYDSFSSFRKRAESRERYKQAEGR